MIYKTFPQELWNQIDQAIEQELKNDQNPVAVFDADGTLWDTDLGEAFFKWQIANCRNQFKIEIPKDPWKHYRDWKSSGDPRPAYLWLAQINAGLPIEQIRNWADQALAGQKPIPVFEEQRRLIQKFLSRGVQVYIVTASVKWAVEPGARMLGLTNENVIGVATQIENGIITNTQEGTITYREGKMEALLKRTSQKPPFFACGNTMGDIALLRGATKISLAVGAAKIGDELFKTEEELRAEAQSQNWLIHKFQQ